MIKDPRYYLQLCYGCARSSEDRKLCQVESKNGRKSFVHLCPDCQAKVAEHKE